MGDWQRPSVALGVLVALAVALALAWRRGWLGRTFLAETVVLVGVWVTAKLAVDADYRDADGYIDCWPSCTALQDSVALGLWLSPVAFVVLGVLAAILATVTGPRGGKRTAEPRLHSGPSPS